MPYYPPRQEHSQRSDPPRTRSAAGRVILCVSAALIIYGGYRLISYGTDWFSSCQTARDLRETLTASSGLSDGEPGAAVSAGEDSQPSAIPAEEGVSSPASANVRSGEQEKADTALAAGLSDKLPAVHYPGGFQMVPRILELRKKSKDIIGWLTMDDLDEPVVHRDNSFFLTRDAMGKKNVNGAIFMDEHTSLLTRPYTILLYGHNMKTGAMFGNLRKYEKFSYCYQHRMIQFDTLYEEGEYVIFAVETISVIPGKNKYLNLVALKSSDRVTRRTALKVLQEHSPHKMLLDVNEEDQLLLLITCVGSEDERLLVAARRLRDGENAEKAILQYKQ